MDEQTFLSGRCFIGLDNAQPLPPSIAARPPPAPHKPFTPLYAKGKGPASSSSTHSTPLPSPSLQPILDDPTLLILNRSDLLPPPASTPTHPHRRPPPPPPPRQVPVVVESFLSRQLRPHQVSGVQFLYDCLLGRTSVEQKGAILADEMGLGKSLQSITLLYTLLRCGPLGPPVVRKGVVVCPSTLVGNWQREFSKWLGTARLRVMAVDASQAKEEQQLHVQAFITGHANNVLIISYEMFRKHTDRLRSLPDGLFICDEGHRLKNSKGNATIAALQSISSRRRLILTGTPVQNDLLEFFAMCDFVNPTVLGSLQTFRLTYEAPIQRSRDSSSSSDDKRLGEARSAELSRLTSTFVLRRTADILRKYLPPKTELVLFCRPSSLQRAVYVAVLKSKTFKRVVDAWGQPQHQRDALALTCIQTLKQIANHPALVYPRCRDEGADEGSELGEALRCFADDYGESGLCSEAESGKMTALLQLLAGVREEKGKVVVVSNYVETLNILQALCDRRHWPLLRLDGAVPSDRRQELVDRFNSPYSSSPQSPWIFLLSAKAGGQGLNLIGGNRLVLVDPDWNPATDLQAMARIWRDGQRLPCYIYRLMATGMIDEKILQRQMRKQEVAGTVMRDKGAGGKRGGGGGGGGERTWDSRSLKELFTFRGVSDCETFDALTAKGGKTGKEGKPATPPKGKDVVVSGKRWECAWRSVDSDDPLVARLSDDVLSCMWSRKSSSEDKEEVESILQQLTLEQDEEEDKRGESAPPDSDGADEKKTTEPLLIPSEGRTSDTEMGDGEQPAQLEGVEEEGKKAAGDGEEEEEEQEAVSTSVESSDDPLADWRLDRIEAERARLAEQRKRKKAQAIRLAEADAQLLREDEEEEGATVKAPPTKTRRRAVLEDDSDEDEFMKGDMPAATPASSPGVRGKGKGGGSEEEEMSAIQALLDQPKTVAC